MGRSLTVSVCCVLVAAVCGAQAPAKPEMTLNDLRQYMDTLHIKEADERGVHAQIPALKAQLPPWWPDEILNAMTERMLRVDFVAIEYPYVKTCMSSEDAQALTALFATHEGQVYGRRMTGAMVAKEAKGTDAQAAHDQMEKVDTGLPLSALNQLTAPQRTRVQRLFTGFAMNCISDGFRMGSTALQNERNRAVRELIQEKRPELAVAQQKYEAEHPVPPAK